MKKKRKKRWKIRNVKSYLSKMTERPPRHLKEFRVCRFCLDDVGPFTNIYEKDSRDGKQQIPLPLQIMACVAIEVFPNDGMPQFICNPCRSQTIGAYNFKTTCKKADDTLKLYLATGNRKLVRPLLKKRVSKNATVAEHIEKFQSIPTLPKPRQNQQTLVTLNSAATVLKRAPISAQPQPPSKRPKRTPAAAQSDDEHPDTETIHITLETDPLAEGEEILPTITTKAGGSSRDGSLIGGRNDLDLLIEGNTTEEDDMGDEEEVGETGDREGRLYDEYIGEGEVRTKAPQNKPVASNIYPCTLCERTFPLTQQLDLHMKNHERIRNFSCSHAGCGRMFFNKYDLSKHAQTHFDYKPFTCVVCEKTFARESLLHRHEKVHVNVPKYLCTQCDRAFLNREDYDAHAEKHKKRRPFQCRICNKSFVFKQGLERHEIAHADEKPHKCNYCEASFTSPIKLMRHITSHAGLRPYPCKLCGRTFLLSHHLTRHLKSHYFGPAGPGAEPPVGQHKCDVCSMSFRRKDSLINHSAIHSMVNLKCVICNTAFDNAKQVKQHITSHLSGLPYPCDKCDYSFDTQDQLEEHELKHAEMEYEEQIEAEVSKEALDDREEEEDDDDGDEDDDMDDGGRRRVGTIENRLYNMGGDDEDGGAEEEEGDEDGEEDMTEFTITESGLVPVQRNKKTRRSLTASINLTSKPTTQNQYNSQISQQFTIASSTIDPPEHESHLIDEPVAPNPATSSHKLPPPVATVHAPQQSIDTLSEDVVIPYADHREIEKQQQQQQLLDSDDTFVDDKRAVEEEIRNLQKEAVRGDGTSLKPIVRSEGTKVYARKAPAQKFKPPVVQPAPITMAPLFQINQSTLDTLGLTQQDVNSMPTKKYMDMKVGDKTVRVQKLIMTKAEIAAMAKEGKIEIKGGNIILKKTKGPLTASSAANSASKPSRISLDNVLDGGPKGSVLNKQKNASKKTYVKKSNVPTAISTPLANVNSELTITPIVSNANVSDTSLTLDVEHIG